VGRPLRRARTEPGETGAESMSKRPRQNHSTAFKAKVALEAVKAEKTVTEIAQRIDV
jgi:transposase-like protein